MTTSPRAAAVKVLAVYWALLVFGMVLYTSIRANGATDPIAVLAPVWTGTILGTTLGQIVALRRYRPLLAVLIVVTIACIGLPQLPDELGGKQVWFAFLPAALCGYWSLGDRTSLAAFWFPAMIWMLSILDGTPVHGARALPSSQSIVLFGALIALFLIFLRVREERRVALWRTIAVAPLAVTKPPVMLAEHASSDVARATWGLFVASLTFGATAWIAPRLWRPEAFAPRHVQVVATQYRNGLPCCPAFDDTEVTTDRVKEYFDLGRGHDRATLMRPGVDCAVCRRTPSYGYSSTGVDAPLLGTGPYYTDTTTPSTPTATTAGGSMTAITAPAGRAGSTEAEPNERNTFGATSTSSSFPSTTYVDSPAAPRAVAAYQPQPPVPTQAVPPPAPVVVAPSAPRTAPIDPVNAAAPLIPASGEAGPSSDASVPPEAHSSGPLGPWALHWVMVLAAGALLFHGIGLALRPLRRYLTLRHLRSPLWNETVDQRVSNSWQLALVGLRDAGWRTRGDEPPAVLARRVKLDGLERCATILDRTRHGIGIDRDDLADMSTSAVTAYQAARARLGWFARTASWLRWPLA